MESLVRKMLFYMSGFVAFGSASHSKAFLSSYPMSVKVAKNGFVVLKNQIFDGLQLSRPAGLNYVIEHFMICPSLFLSLPPSHFSLRSKESLTPFTNSLAPWCMGREPFASLFYKSSFYNCS